MEIRFSGPEWVGTHSGVEKAPSELRSWVLSGEGGRRGGRGEEEEGEEEGEEQEKEKAEET